MRSTTRSGCTAFVVALLAASPVLAQVPYRFSATRLEVDVRKGNGPQALAVVDVDGQNGPDILVVDTNNFLVDVFLNDGAGTYGDPTPFSTDDNPVAVATGDFRHKGVFDIVTANDNNPATVSFLANDGTGNFDESADPIPFGVVGAVGVVAADFDNDGTLDLAVLNNNSIYLLKGGGDGTFAPFSTPIVSPGRGTGCLAIAAGNFDVNNGNTVDLVVSNGDNSQVAVLLGNGDGTFKPARLVNVNTRPLGLVVSDLDRNGSMDIAVADSAPTLFDQNVSILLGNNDGTFTAQIPPADGEAEGVTALAAADLDGDGRPELAVTISNTSGDDNITISENCSLDQTTRCPGNQPIFGGFFQLQSFVQGLNLGDGQVAIQAADLNHDGRIDLVALGQSGVHIGVFINNTGAPTATPATPVTPATPTATPLVSATPSATAVTATPTATPTPPPTATPTQIPTAPYGVCNTNDPGQPTVGGKPVAVTTGRFNRDLDSPGIAVADQQNNKIILLQPSITTAESACGVLGLSHDPSKDVLNVSSPVALTAEYMDHCKPPADPTRFCRFPLDFDHDGKVDLAVVGTTGLSVFYGDGTGGFVAAAANPMAVKEGTPNSIAIADLNRDGFLDILVGNQTSTSISVFLAGPGRSFQADCPISVGRATSLVVAQDLNGDGRQDFAVASEQTNQIAAFLQLTPTPTSTPGSGTCADLASGFRGLETFPRAGLSAIPKALILDNFDPSDAIPDLAVAVSPSVGSGSVVVFLGKSTASGDVSYQAAGNPLVVPPNGSRPSALASADINLDGRSDLIVTDKANSDIVIYLGGSDGSFSTPLMPLPLRGIGPVALAVADIDGDGRPDIVTANSGDGSVSILVSSRPPATPTPLPTATPTVTGTPTDTSTPTSTPTPSATLTPTPSGTPTRTRLATLTATQSPPATLKPGTLSLSSCAIDPNRGSGGEGPLLWGLIGVIMRCVVTLRKRETTR